MSGFKVRRFRLSDLAAYRERAVETIARDWFAADGLEHLEQDPHAMTMEVDGVPVASGGLTDQGDGLAYAWAALTPVPAICMVAMHKTYLAQLQNNRFARIETFVEAGFHRSLRWCRVLGFEMDAANPTVLLGGAIFVRMVFLGNNR